VELPATTMPVLERHRERQNEFRAQAGSRYRADLDLIFANPDGTPLRPNSVSGTVSRICKQVGLPKGASLHVLRHYAGFRTIPGELVSGPLGSSLANIFPA
jgi:site-specific recombinase XerD